MAYISQYQYGFNVPILLLSKWVSAYTQYDFAVCFYVCLCYEEGESKYYNKALWSCCVCAYLIKVLTYSIEYRTPFVYGIRTQSAQTFTKLG